MKRGSPHSMRFKKMHNIRTIYYIDTRGSDGTGDGSSTNPWLTLSYACTQATTSGDIIYVNPGFYIENTVSNLATGVSIRGAGDTSIIKSEVGQYTESFYPTINLSSGSVDTKGNQSISHIKMNGDSEIAWGGIMINARSNVKVHHCTFEDFHYTAAVFNGKVSTGDQSEPTKWCTGNKFYSNTVTNCAYKLYEGAAAGALHVGSQDGMLIYGNTITQTSRSTGTNGYPMKLFTSGFNRGVKIYDNIITPEAANNLTYGWNFAIELWNCRGGIEIYDNTIYGAIDFGGATTTKGAYDYAGYVHNNIIGYTALQDITETTQCSGIYIEREQEGPLIIRYNLFRNLALSIQCAPSETDAVDNIYIQYNIFNGIGTLASNTGAKALWWGSVDAQKNSSLDNFNFDNNVVYVGAGGAGLAVQLPDQGTATNVNVRNNILQGSVWNPISSNLAGGATIDILSIENNVFYSNGDDTVLHAGNAPTNDTTQNNLVSDPEFNDPGTDYHLQTGSPSENTGLDINLELDYEGVDVDATPNRGSYETMI